MKTRWTTRPTAILALACALFAAACSDGFNPTEPTWAPALSQHGRSAKTQLTADSQTSASESVSGGGHLVESDLNWPSTAASVVIGPEGGEVELWAASPRDSKLGPSHSLKVPRDAVSEPTLFVMEIGLDPTIDVFLSAVEISSGRRITEFFRPLKLRLTYAGSAVEDPSRLGIVYVKDGIIIETVETRVITRHELLVGEIWHFSRYAVAWE